jgi:hypothetical protein
MSKRIGYWRQSIESNEDLPWPTIRKLPQETKNKVLSFLGKGKVIDMWKGYSNCRICDKMNGSTCLQNKGFIYPEGYAHYIKDHNVMPDAELLAEILTSYAKT